MSEPDSLPPLPHHGSILVRRVLARIIDDGLLVTLAVGCATVGAEIGKSFEPGGSESELQVYGIIIGRQPEAVAVAALMTIALVVAYYAVTSLFEGRSLGRTVTSIRVVRADGRTPTTSALFGREVLRVALVGLALALVSSVTSPLAISAYAVQQPIGETVTIWIGVILLGLPTSLVVAGWLGAAAVDDEGRASVSASARLRSARREA